MGGFIETPFLVLKICEVVTGFSQCGLIQVRTVGWAVFEEFKEGRGAQNREGAYLISAVGTSKRQIPASGRELSSQMGGRGPSQVGWGGVGLQEWPGRPHLAQDPPSPWS